MRKVTIIGVGPGNPDLLSRAALDAILRQGGERARALAAPTLAATYDALGLVRG